MHGIKGPTCGYQNCNTIQILIFGRFVTVKASFYTRVIIWVNIIVNHINISTILPIYEGPCMLYTQMVFIKNAIKYSYPTIIKNCAILIIDTRMVFNKNDTSPTLVITLLV
jgi:hypothetical protein